MGGARSWKAWLRGRLPGGAARVPIDRAASIAVVLLAAVCVVLAGAAGLGSELPWPTAAAGAFVGLVGVALVVSGRGHTGVLTLALGIGALLVWCAYLPRDAFAPAPAAAAEPAGVPLDAVDARIARALSGSGAGAAALAIGSFGPFDAGESDLSCDTEPARASVDALRDGLRRAADRRQRSVLMIVGATDRRPLTGRLLRRYGSNDGLAAARVERVLGCLAMAVGSGKTAPPAVLRLLAGPVYTPDTSPQARVAEAAMALDRRVVALVLGVPGATAAVAPASAAAPPPGAPKSGAVVAAVAAPPPGSEAALVIALALLAVSATVLSRLPLRPARSIVDAKARPWDVSNDLVEAAISHVRDLHQMFAELRTKNFNFFIVIIGAAITGVASVSGKTGPQATMISFVISCAAALACVVFFGIERRTVEMLGDARAELERLEDRIGVALHRNDRWVGPGTRSRWITHSSMYLLVFVSTYLAAIVAIYRNYPW